MGMHTKEFSQQKTAICIMDGKGKIFIAMVLKQWKQEQNNGEVTKPKYTETDTSTSKAQNFAHNNFLLAKQTNV